MVEPYYRDAAITLYHGDMREIMPRVSTCRQTLVVKRVHDVGSALFYRL